MPDALPAVIENPGISGCSTGSAASLSSVVSRRGCSSTSNTRVSPFPPCPGVTDTSTAKISSRNRPSSVAAIARWCEWYAHSSCSSREMLHFCAVFHPTVIDMSRSGASGVARWLGESHGITPL
jgi:hypothetical protein